MTKVVMYDGVCKLCSWGVSIVKKKSPPELIQCIPYQRKPEVFQQYPEIPKDMSSVAFIDEGKVYLESTGVLKACSYLSFPYWTMSGLLVVPAFLRNPLYRFIARNRYSVFGKKDQCD